MLDFGYYNMDCLEGMKEFPDNYFDLAIADPPYGSGEHYTFGARKKYSTYQDRRNMGGEIRKK